MRFVSLFFACLFVAAPSPLLEDIPHVKKDSSPYKVEPQKQDLNVQGSGKKLYELLSNNKKEC